MTRARAHRETSAGGVVYRLDPEGGEPLFLLIRDSYSNWGFPKGHLESGERADEAAVREVREETGLRELVLRGGIETIDWYFRFRGRLIHKVCHFFLMETTEAETAPQRTEGITACQWTAYDEAEACISYANARLVLRRAREMIAAGAGAGAGAAGAGMGVPASRPPRAEQLGLPLEGGEEGR